jgi:hypothetical protein
MRMQKAAMGRELVKLPHLRGTGEASLVEMVWVMV